jgi:hypothetical protein
MPVITISKIISYWENTKDLPSFFGSSVQAGMLLTPLALLYLILPFGREVNDHYMNYGEFWTSGAGITLFLFVVLDCIGCWGIAARKPNSRWACVFSTIMPMIPAVLFHYLSGAAWCKQATLQAGMVSAIIPASIIYAYLFHSSAVRAYFKAGKRDQF